jgi:hypothetical protein
MFLPKNQFSELLLELSEEQQETVAGGISIETNEGHYNIKKVEFKDEKTSKGESEDFVWPPIFTAPFQFNLANTTSFGGETPFFSMR